MTRTGCRIAALVAGMFTAASAAAQTPGTPAQPTVEQALGAIRVEQTMRRAASQPGSASVAPVTEALLLGSQEGAAASARIGTLTNWGNREALGADLRLTNKPPDEGLPVLTTLDGLSDGAEVSGGFSWIRYPDSVVSDAAGMRDACDRYYAAHRDRQPADYQPGACVVDEETEGDVELLRAIAPFVRARWAYALQARIAWSRPSFSFRPDPGKPTETAAHQQHALRIAGSVLTPASVSPGRASDLLGSWFITVGATLGNDWEGASPQTICTPLPEGASLECETVAVGAPSERDVQTLDLSARKYLTDWLAVAPAWSHRWSSAPRGTVGPDSLRWSVEVPVYFLTDPDRKGLTGGVAFSWSNDGGRQYSVFVGAVLPPFEF